MKGHLRRRKSIQRVNHVIELGHIMKYTGGGGGRRSTPPLFFFSIPGVFLSRCKEPSIFPGVYCNHSLLSLGNLACQNPLYHHQLTIWHPSTVNTSQSSYTPALLRSSKHTAKWNNSTNKKSACIVHCGPASSGTCAHVLFFSATTEYHAVRIHRRGKKVLSLYLLLHLDED